MGSTETRAEYPATSEDMTAALNAALEAGDLERTMGIMGQMARAHRMRRVARETGLGEKSLYKSMRAGASPEFNTVLRVLRSLGFCVQVHPVAGSADEYDNRRDEQTKKGARMKKHFQPLTPAALYARVSSDRQDVDLSVAAQLRALRDYAKNNGYSIAREYVDEAESGRIADRPQFRNMIDEGGNATAPFQVILVWKFSRFTRKREHAVAFKPMLRRKGIRVVSITEHADDSPTGKLMEAIIESVDEFYSENLAQEVVRGMREAASRGYFLASKAPFGYNRIKVSDGVKDRPTLEIDPVAAPIVKEIFESSRRGNGLKEICKELNGRGITNRGKRWQKNIVHYLLTNEAYTGTAVWGVKSKDEKAQEPVRVENAWPALVSRETFDLVQQGLHERAPTVQRPARVGSPVPAERAAPLRGVWQALLGPGSQERPVRLLRLRQPVPRGSRGLHRPLPERHQGREPRSREGQG